MANFKDYKAPKPTIFEKFLWWCCGADKQIMVESTYADYAKYSGLGGIVLATGILAALSMGFAMTRVFSDLGEAVYYVAIPVALLWGAIIFNLDRFIVSSTGKGDGSHDISLKEMAHALPRVIMAALIGFAISGPLEVYVFQKEIDKQWEKRKDEEKAIVRKELESYKKADEIDLRKILAGLEIEKNKFNEQISHLTEMIADETTRVRCGPICEGHKRQRAELQIEMQAKEKSIAVTNESIAAILSDREEQIKLREKHFSGKLGLLDSLKALEDYPGSTMPSWLLRLLFVFIEIAPVFFKLMIAYSPYDYLSDNLKFIKLANQGIEAKQGYTKLENGDIYDQVIYHEAESVFRQNLAKLHTDESLHGKIVEKYKAHEEKNIETNPDDYIKP